MPYDPERFFVPETVDEITQQIVDIINEIFNDNKTVSNFKGTNWYSSMFPMIQMLSNLSLLLSALPDNIVNYIRTTNQTNLEGSTTTTIGIEASLKQLVDLEIITDFSFASYQEENSGLPEGYIGFALTLKTDTEQNRLAVAQKLFEIVPVGPRFFVDGATVQTTIVSPLGTSSAVVGWHNLEIKLVTVELIAELAGDNSLKLSQSDIINTVLENFQFNTTGIIVNRLKEGLVGFKRLHIRVSVDGGTTWIGEDGIIPKDFKTKYQLLGSNIKIVNEFQ